MSKDKINFCSYQIKMPFINNRKFAFLSTTKWKVKKTDVCSFVNNIFTDWPDLVTLPTRDSSPTLALLPSTWPSSPSNSSQTSSGRAPPSWWTSGTRASSRRTGRSPAVTTLPCPSWVKHFNWAMPSLKKSTGWTFLARITRIWSWPAGSQGQLGHTDWVLYYVRSGKRASVGKGQLEELGYTNIRVYKGSFLDWKAQGGDVEWEPSEQNQDLSHSSLSAFCIYS